MSSEVLQRWPSQGGPRYALVDHNVLLPLFRSNVEQAEGAGDKVVAILDHHVDEQQHLDASPRTIKVVGSCASLVVEHFSALLPPSTQLPSALADLLLSAILIDTGLKPTTTGGKATPTDLTAVQYLLPFSSFRSSSTLPSSFTAAEPVAAPDPFAPLLAVNKILGDKKFDVAHLSGRDLLRRDYKEYVSSPSEGGWRYGLSTVPLPLSTWLAKEREGLKGWELVEQDVEAWMRERRLNFAAVLTSFQSAMETSVKKGGAGKHQRELLLHIGAGEGSKKLEGLFDGLEKDETLQLGRWKGGDVPNVVGGKWKVWQQGALASQWSAFRRGELMTRSYCTGNAKATRKQVAPVVKAILHAL